MPDTRKTIDLVADYFTGAAVAHNSICLALPSPHSVMAKRFFDVRTKLGIEGYATKEEAAATLADKLGVELAETR